MSNQAAASATLSGTVLFAGAGKPGVAVALLNAAGTVVATTTTGSNGIFRFTGLAAGTYHARYTAPAGKALPENGPANFLSGLTAPVTLTGDEALTLSTETLVSSADDIGVYLGYPGSASFDTSLSQYATTVGAAPSYVDVGEDYSQPIASWVGSAQAEAAELRAATDGATVIPVVAIPMISTVADGLTELQNFSAIASGADDSTWLGIVQAYEAKGYTTIDVRIGWEENGNWQPWAVSNEATAQGFIAAFQHISTVVRNVPGLTVNVIWNPAELVSSAVPTTDSYPGNNYVNIIGIDAYDSVFPLSLYDWSTHKVDATLAQWEANPVNLEHFWTYPDATQYAPTGSGKGFGLADALAFAKANGKALGLPETGAGGVSASASADDAIFPQYLAATLLAAGGPAIAFANIWDSGAYTFSDGSKPNEAAAWAAFVKALNQAGSGSQPDPGPSDSPGSTTVGHGQTVNLGGQVAALITPGRAGDTETITAVSAVLGKATLGSGGAITYTAPASGTDTLTYTVTDQLGDVGVFTDTITIDPGPSGGGGGITVAHGRTSTLTSQLLALVKPGLAGDTETITAIHATLGTVALGSGGAVTYTAAAKGTGTLTYTVTDQAGDTASFSTAILADPGPQLAAGSTGVAAGQTAALGPAIAALVTPGVAGDTETITAVSAAKGTATLGAKGAIGYAAPAAAGADTLTYTVTDQYGDTATGTYAVAVTATPASISGSTSIFGPSYPSSGGVQGGVTVALIDASGKVVATTVSNGSYVFRTVSPGTYRLQYTAPAGEVLQPGGPANVTTGLTASFTVTSGQSYGAPKAGFVLAASITGTVLLAGTGLAGVTVTALNAAGSAVATTTTGSGGAFAFSALEAGTYQLRYTAPAGDTFQSGGPASTATGLTGAVTLAAGQAVALGAETLAAITGTGTVTGTIHHFGSADPIWGTGQSGVGVALLNAAGVTVATTVANGGAGWFSLSSVPTGTYQLRYTLPAGEAIQPGGTVDTTTGLSAPFTVTPGANPWLPTVAVISSSNTFALNGPGAIALRGDGDYTVTGNASSGTLTLGNGNDSISLTGGGNTINTGSGNDTIMALGSHNLINAGPGISFITLDASAGNTVMLNAAGQGLETISGFHAGDVLDLARTLAGTGAASNLSNLASYVTATSSGGNTTLLVHPTGSGAGSAFAELSGVTTTVASLIAGKNISLTT